MDAPPRPDSSALKYAESLLQDTSKDPVERIFAVMQTGDWPESLFHQFACDCAERALQHEEHQGHHPAPACWDAIHAKRQWLRREITQEQLEEAVTAVQGALHNASIQQQCYEATAAATDAAREVVYAVRAAAWAATAIAHNAPPDQSGAVRASEAVWQIQRFQQILRTFAEAIS